MCECRSYNRPDLGGTVGEIVVSIPDHIKPDTHRAVADNICLDLCIAPVVLRLWAENIPTLGSCCGHNGAFSRSVIVEERFADTAEEVVQAMGDAAEIYRIPNIEARHE